MKPEKRSGLSQKECVRRRIHTQIDQENYTFFPAKEPRDFFGESSRLSVAVYARVSTGNVEQTSSYELQKSITRITSAATPTGLWRASTPMRESLLGPSGTIPPDDYRLQGRED